MNLALQFGIYHVRYTRHVQPAGPQPLFEILCPALNIHGPVNFVKRVDRYAEAWLVFYKVG